MITVEMLTARHWFQESTRTNAFVRVQWSNQEPRTKIAHTYEKESWFGGVSFETQEVIHIGCIKPRFLTRVVCNLGSWFEQCTHANSYSTCTGNGKIPEHDSCLS